jgi:hypothetical protein
MKTNSKRRVPLALFLTSLTLFGLDKTARADFTIAALPDTQFYSDEGGSADGLSLNAMYTTQTDWIQANCTSSNIVYVASLGDMSNSGDTTSATTGLTSLQQWRNVTNAMYRLESPISIPYGPCVGNHDQTPNGSPTGTTTGFNTYFGFSHFNGRAYYGGRYGTSNNDNHYDLFSAEGKNYIAVYLEYDANNAVPGALTWADNLLTTYNSRKAIIVSHYITDSGAPAAFGAQGQRIYDMAKTHTNVFLMLCGHVTGKGRRQDVYNGSTITTIMADYQGYTEGGAGYLRTYRISTTNNTISSKAYSPYHGTTLTDGNNQFVLPLRVPTLSGRAFVNDERMTCFGINATNGSIMINYQGSVGGSWVGWQSLGGGGNQSIDALLLPDGRFTAFACGGGDAWIKWQNTAGGAWTSWTSLGGTNQNDIHAFRYLDGRNAILSISTPGILWARAQTASNGAWAAWQSFPATSNPLTKISPVLRGNETFAVAAVGGGKVYFNSQTAYNSSWSGWVDLGGTTFTNAQMVNYSDGRLCIIAHDGQYLWNNTQISPGNGAWGGWQQFPETGIAGFHVIRQHTDALILFAAKDGGTWINWNSPGGGSWVGLQNLGGNGFQRIDGAAMFGDGGLCYFASAPGGVQYVNAQDAYNSTWQGLFNLGGTMK